MKSDCHQGQWIHAPEFEWHFRDLCKASVDKAPVYIRLFRFLHTSNYEEVHVERETNESVDSRKEDETLVLGAIDGVVVEVLPDLLPAADKCNNCKG